MKRREQGFGLTTALMLLLFTAALGSIAWVSLGIVAKERWPIRWLEVNGSFERVSAEQLRSKLMPMISSSYFTGDLPQLRMEASEIAWISRVSIQKKWPDTVSVLVFEYTPVAHWNHDQLISAEGDAFSVPAAQGLQGLPWLSGPEERLNDVLDHWVSFNDALLPLGVDIQNLKLDDRGAWSLVLSNGSSVQLGRQHAQDRLERLVNSWAVLMDERETAPTDIDLRYTNGFAVNWPIESEAGKDS